MFSLNVKLYQQNLMDTVHTLDFHVARHVVECQVGAYAVYATITS